MRQYNKGSVLLIALVFLLLLAIAGVASIRMNTNSSLIAQATIDRERAFQHAEAALIAAQDKLFAQNFSVVDSIGGLVKIAGTTETIKSCSAGSLCFSSSCSDGLCFTGQYSINNRTHSCSYQELELENIDWSKAVSQNGASFLVEFVCFKNISGVETSIDLPMAPWSPKFKVTSRYYDDITGTDVVLISYMAKQPRPAPPGIFSVNNNLLDVANIRTGFSSLVAEFCMFSCDPTQSFGDQMFDENDIRNAVYDWNTTEGVSVGGGIWGRSVDTTSCDPSNLTLSGNCARFLDLPMSGGGSCGVLRGGCTDSTARPVVSGIGVKQADLFFMQYFGTSDRNLVRDSSFVISGANFGNPPLDPDTNQPIPINSNGGVITPGREIIFVEVDYDQINPPETITYRFPDSAKFHSESILIVRPAPRVDGSVPPRLIMTPPVSSVFEPVGLIYVEGDIDFSGSVRLPGTLAVEGDAYTRLGLHLLPKVNAADLIAGAFENKSSLRRSWYQN